MAGWWVKTLMTGRYLVVRLRLWRHAEFTETGWIGLNCYGHNITRSWRDWTSRSLLLCFTVETCCFVRQVGGAKPISSLYMFLWSSSLSLSLSKAKWMLCSGTSDCEVIGAFVLVPRWAPPSERNIMEQLKRAHFNFGFSAELRCLFLI